MEKIQEKQKEIEEYKFRLREMSGVVKGNLELLKDNIPTYREMGMVAEEDLKYLEELTLETIDNKTFDEQIELIKRLETIKVQIEEATELLEQRIQELEEMM